MSKQQRTGILNRLLGDAEAAKTREDLQQAEELLDKLGLERKEHVPTEEIDAVLQAVVGALAEANVIEAAVAGAPGISSEDDFYQLVGEAAMGAIEAMAHEEAGEAKQEEEEEEAEEMPEEEEEEEKAIQGKDLNDTISAVVEERMKDVTDTLAQSIEDQGDLAKAVLEVAESLKDFKEMREEIAALKEVVDMRPRQATKDASTLFDVDKKTMQEALKSLAEGKSEFLGMPLKEPLPK